jgi:hypothetical protein
LLLIGFSPTTTKLIVGTLDRPAFSSPTTLTPLASWAGSVRYESNGSISVCSCAAMASKVAVRSFDGVSERRYGRTPVDP